MNSSPNEVSGESLAEGPFLDRLADLLPRLSWSMVRQEGSYLNQGGMTLPQLWALELLRREGPCSMRQVLSALGLKSSTGTLFVDRLCRMRMVRRHHDARDRRTVLVEITSKGTRTLNEVQGHRHAALAKLFRPFNARERRDYLRLLEKLAAELLAQKDG